MPVKRMTSSDEVLRVWRALRSINQSKQVVDLTKIVKFLQKEYSYSVEDAEKLIENTVADGLIERHTYTGVRGTRKGIETRSFLLPKLDPAVDGKLPHDWYCYECHKPGDVLECQTCPRVFHEHCNPAHIQMDTDPADFRSTVNLSSGISQSADSLVGLANDSQQLSQIDDGQQEVEVIVAIEPAFDDDEDDTKEIVDRSGMVEDEVNYLKHFIKADLDAIDSTNVVTSTSFDTPPLKKERHNSDPSEHSAAVESQPTQSSTAVIDTKDVMFVGVVRSSNKRLAAAGAEPQIKPEIEPPADDEQAMLGLCKVCRIKTKTNITMPPDMSEQEMNYLMTFTFARIKSWIPEDTYSALSPEYSHVQWMGAEDLELFRMKCMRFPVTITEIKEKLKTTAYCNLDDFFCELLDVQHCVAILHGATSSEYEATKYLINDCRYELSEIRQCRDCYRHSNEKSGPMWFANPCKPRHELVFAKQIGYNYWPAKVIKVTNNQYDVRFFGTKHLRAVIDAQHVKSIDTNIKTLKIKRTSSFNKAMEELHKHQELLQHQPGTYSFEEFSLNNRLRLPSLDGNASTKKIRTYLAKSLNPKTSSKKRPTAAANQKTKSDNIGAAAAYKSFSSNISRNASKSGGGVVQSTPIHTQNHVDGMTVNNNNTIVAATPNSKKRKRTVAPQPIYDNNSSYNVTTGDANSDGEASSTHSTISDYIDGGGGGGVKKSKRSAVNSSSHLQEGICKNGIGDKADILNAGESIISIVKTIESNVSDLEPTIIEPSTSEHIIMNSLSTGNVPPVPESSASSPDVSPPTLHFESPRIKARIERVFGDVVGRLRNQLTTTTDVAEASRLALDTLKQEIDRWQMRTKQLVDTHTKQISEIKKKQWCYLCEAEAIYHCCWNTAYCSHLCQQQHWQAEHKKFCRRKR